MQPRQRINSLWLWLSFFIGLFAAGVFSSLTFGVIVFAIIYVALICNDHVRLTPRGGGRGRRP